jgi:hypothetical protein
VSANDRLFPATPTFGNDTHEPDTTAASLKLHRFLTTNHWKDGALIGPDPGVRLNYRIFRFVKSYLPVVPWRDDLYYVQGQGYWILANWRLFALTGDENYRTIALACSRTLLAHQRLDGAWDYPNPEWRGRVATAEGTWGAIGLLETYRWTRDADILTAILRWHVFVEGKIGYQEKDGRLAVNYFAGEPAARVPNNTAFWLRFLAELTDATGIELNTDQCRKLTAFLCSAQKKNGEFPYSLEGEQAGDYVEHFQCFQYNAFQCLDLLRYYELTGGKAALALAERVLGFLVLGLDQDGHAHYECGNSRRAVTYHAAVLAAAFDKATSLGVGDYSADAARAYRYVLAQQRRNGSFPHSYHDYSVVSDRRSYPRYLSMILYHLLQPETLPTRKGAAQTALR